MLTDWVLIRRLAEEIDGALRGARVEDAGLLDDGRFAIAFRRRGNRSLLAIDLFGSPPVVTIEEGEFAVAEEPGFVRALARSLRGMTLGEATSRPNDRLARLTFTTRSRFGVGDVLDLYLELVPRFGNAVLVKHGTIVAAYKEFALAENPRRAVQSGSPYELPPIPQNPKMLAEQPPGPVLELFARARAQRVAQSGEERVASRLRAVQKRLDERERRLRAELESLSAKREHAVDRQRLRAEGESLLARLHELPDTQRDEAKERAATLFAEYKRLGKSIPHIDARERQVRDALEAVETLRWESERAGAQELDAVETAVASLGPQRRGGAAARPRKEKRALLEFRTPRGSRILVGRSPIENAEITFRQARPNDLWFHAQRIPGAHVILARDDRAVVPDADVEAAASLAAFHSRAKASSGVPVDYTLRKHVRKQRAAPPGLVWYTHAKTIVVEPRKDPP